MTLVIRVKIEIQSSIPNKCIIAINLKKEFSIQK